MRIPSGDIGQHIYFVAVDSTDLKTRKTGLTTFTVYRSRNNAASAVMTTPTVTELDATNMPGVYSLLLDEDMTITSGDDSEEMVFHITQAVMAPVTRTIELYRPKVTLGDTLASTSGALDTVTTATTATTATSVTTVNGLAANTITAASLAADAGAEIAGAVWEEATASHVTGTTFGGSSQWTTATGFATPANVTAVWDELLTNHVVAGSFGAGVIVSVNNDKAGYALASTDVTLSAAERDAVATALLTLTDGIETGFNVKQALRLISASVAGILSGAATSTITIKALDKTTTRLTATVDASGNRTAITYVS